MSVEQTIKQQDEIVALICERIRRAFVSHTGRTGVITVTPDGMYRRQGTQMYRFKITGADGWERHYMHYYPEINQVLRGQIPVAKLWINPKNF